MKTRTHFLIAGLVLVALGLGAFIWSQWPTPPAPASKQPEVRPVATPAAVAHSAPTIRHPISAASAAASTPEAREPDGSPQERLRASLIEFVGRKAALSFLQLDSFVYRLVATVDNLDRQHAPPRVWPVNPTAGRFTVTGVGANGMISRDNAQRYAPLVQFVESIDAGRAVALYVRLYPLFQQVYVELGYPNKYFNDRLVDVIDHLLATPDMAEPLGVALTEVKGPIQSLQPWVHYEFSDSSIESRSAGQKMLLRAGRVNARKMKAKLGEFRRLLTGQGIVK
ncbi:MAG: DUF3014 domain-containing protein [Burkholderiaceae bacterium]|nr:DUF3014 domain-containing protein [Burkholderiaceae bacterium]